MNTSVVNDEIRIRAIAAKIVHDWKTGGLYPENMYRRALDAAKRHLASAEGNDFRTAILNRNYLAPKGAPLIGEA